jgi:peptidoglycan/xylan/chitin deacetylase (PgdA/CDA1 family)
MKKILKLFGILIFVIVLSGIVCWSYLTLSRETPILMYHSFDAGRTKTYAAVAAQVFYKQMRFIKQNGYRVIGLDEYCRLLRERKPVARNYVVITIDDGYKDNLEAIKILKNFGFPATIFIIADRIGTPGYLSQEDINWFLANTKIKIGSHTLTHPGLAYISQAQLKKEIVDSKKELEALFSEPVSTIAYPTGVFNEEVLREAEFAGYICGCTTNRVFSKKLNRFALRRIKITSNDTGISLWMKLRGFYNFFRKLKKPF